jgi:hypothetical protein
MDEGRWFESLKSPVLAAVADEIWQGYGADDVTDLALFFLGLALMARGSFWAANASSLRRPQLKRGPAEGPSRSGARRFGRTFSVVESFGGER